jgi:hypothetical protein
MKALRYSQEIFDWRSPDFYICGGINDLGSLLNSICPPLAVHIAFGRRCAIGCTQDFT